MKAGTSPERASSLMIELAARSATVDGKRVVLPPTEFSLLAVLAARPGQVVPHRELLAEAFGDSAYMTRDDIHWYIHRIRARVGDKDRRHPLVANRRGVGYLVDLPTRAVRVVEGVAPEPIDEPSPQVIDLDAPTSSDSKDVAPAPPPKVADEPQPRPPRHVRHPLRGILMAVLVAALALGGSWFAGYRLSQLGGSENPAPPPSDEAAPDSGPREQQEDGGLGRQRKSKAGKKAGGKTATTTVGSTEAESSSGDDPMTGGVTQEQRKEDDKQDRQPKPVPPQPDAQLYHLFNPDSGDHFMTTSPSAANQKQAQGYQSSLEGKVFSTQKEGTIAIALDSGSAYVYRDSASAPQGVSVTALYRLANEGDFYYTVSSSQANQAEAQGWSRSTVGYVVP